MAEKCKCGCMLTWLSGFFAAPAIAHLVKILLKWDILINGAPFTNLSSWKVIIVCALLSILFGVMACRRNKADQPASGCC